MGFRSLNFRVGLARVVFTACCFVFWLAQAEDLKKQTSAAPVSTNAPPQSAARRDALKELENDLLRPFRRFFSGNSSNDRIGRPPPQTRLLAPSKRERELLERKKNWIFLTDRENLSSKLNEKEIFNLKDLSPPEEQEKEKLAPMERYYQSLQRHGGYSVGASKNDEGNSLAPVRPAGPRKLAEDEDDLPSGALGESARALKKLFNTESDKDSRTQEGVRPKNSGSSIFTDIFGSESKTPSRSEVEAQKARMDEYRQILGVPTFSPGCPNSLNPVSSLINSKPQAVAPYLGIVNSSGSASHQSTPVQPGAIGSVHTPASFPDLAVKLPVLPNLTDPAPKYEPPKVTPPAPTFTAPRRAFQ